MNIPRYWAKASQPAVDPNGKKFLAQCWRWSNASESDARRLARDALADILRQVSAGEVPDRYHYGQRPLREEIIESFSDGEGRGEALISRNGYGALILNTANVMFVDIDFESEGFLARWVAGVERLLGRQPETQEIVHMRRLHRWVDENRSWGMRVYRTRAGLRCLVTHETFDPSRASTTEILRGLGADALYVRLCRDQESFRARLSPKPWRCGLRPPPNKHPRATDGELRRFRQWEVRYNQASSRYSVCRLIAELGRVSPHPDVDRILAVHDRHACLDPSLRLA